MNSALEKRLAAIENSTNPNYEHLISALPELDAYIAESCGGHPIPAINPKGPRFVSLAMLRLCEYMRSLAGIQYSSYEEFKNGSQNPLSKEQYV